MYDAKDITMPEIYLKSFHKIRTNIITKNPNNRIFHQAHVKTNKILFIPHNVKKYIPMSIARNKAISTTKKIR